MSIFGSYVTPLTDFLARKESTGAPLSRFRSVDLPVPRVPSTITVGFLDIDITIGFAKVESLIRIIAKIKQYIELNLHVQILIKGQRKLAKIIKSSINAKEVHIQVQP